MILLQVRIVEVNAEYAYIIRNRQFDEEPQTEELQEESLRYPEIINQLMGLDGLIIELIGDWIWLSGNTYPYRAQLKQIGFYFASKKVMWYYRPVDYKSSNKLPKTIEAIREKYGSEKLFLAREKFELKC